MTSLNKRQDVGSQEGGLRMVPEGLAWEMGGKRCQVTHRRSGGGAVGHHRNGEVSSEQVKSRCLWKVVGI